MRNTLKGVSSFCDRAYIPLFLILIVSLPLSYQPLIHLASQAGAHYDLTVIYITMFALGLSALPALYRHRRKLLRNKYNVFALLFLAWNIASLGWSANELRSIATTGVIGLGVFVFLSIQVYREQLLARKRIILHTMLVTLAVLALFCLWQLFGEALGASPSLTLLPKDYQSALFGFARITGFSAEPEFLGSLLLAPLGILTYLSLRSHTHLYRWSLLIVITLIALTLSRGALLSGGVVCLIILICNWRHTALANGLTVIGIGIASLCLGVALLAGAAGLNTRDNISTYQSFSKAINQLTLGVVSLPQQTAPDTTASELHAHTSSDSPAQTRGYVESSTSSRFQMVNQGLRLFTSSPANLLVGVGVGGFGVSLHAHDTRFSESSIVNNQFIEVAAELGIIGLGLFVSFFGFLVAHLIRARQWLYVAIIAGLLVQWCFFSGYPNVLHLWVILGVALVFSYTPHRRQA